MVKLVKKEKEIIWTNHAKQKLRQYRFSEKRILRIFRRPDRVEEGIAEGTIAAMQITGTKKHPTEAWVMYVVVRGRNKKSKFKIISAWRYPGRTPANERPLIPYDTLVELGLI